MSTATQPPMQPLQGKAALVTGGTRRIGRSIALRLAALGADVAVTWRTSRDAAERLLRDLEQAGARALEVQADLGNSDQVRRTIDAINAAWGRLDIVVNNAGRYEDVAFAEISDRQWHEMIDTNLTAPFLVSREAVPLMRRSGGGRIIQITSIGARRAFPAHAHYCAAKAGLEHLTRTMARALAPEIQVNAVAPGLIVFDSELSDWEKKLVARTPMRRAGTGEDVAEAVAFLATCTPFLTGQVLVVDGGLSLV